MIDSPDPFAPVERVGDTRFRVTRVKSYRFPRPTILIQLWRHRTFDYIHLHEDSTLEEIEAAVRKTYEKFR